MTDKKPAVTCIGLANVDVVATVDEDFIKTYRIAKGASTILDASTTGMIMSKLSNPVFHPGGCAANMACGLALYGIDTRFIGRTGDDTYADIFRQGFRDYNIRYDTTPYPQKMTSICLTLVTPDKDRSFAFCTDTAGWYIAESDLPDLPNDGQQYVYMESNAARIKTASNKTLLEAGADKYAGTGVQLVINLNDREIVQETRGVLLGILKKDIAFFICNISEIQALFDTSDTEEAFRRIHATGKKFAVTDGANGAYVLVDGTVEHVPAIALHSSRIINTLGAGDQFAAGFIAGLALGLNYRDACLSGITAATGIIQETSARPPKNRKKQQSR